jgi:hypothetical protein
MGMKDDNLDDVQKHKSPNNAELPVPTFHCAICGKDSEGFSICLKCSPQKYSVRLPETLIAPSVFEVEIWNAAIEAAAKCNEHWEITAVHIRALKK